MPEYEHVPVMVMGKQGIPVASSVFWWLRVFRSGPVISDSTTRDPGGRSFLTAVPHDAKMATFSPGGPVSRRAGTRPEIIVRLPARVDTGPPERSHAKTAKYEGPSRPVNPEGGHS